MVILLHKSSSGSPKDRWNASHYVQVKISAKPEIAAAFKAACSAADVSLASVLSEFMIEYSQNSNTGVQGNKDGTSMVKPRLCRTCYKAKPDANIFSTRRKRRAAVKAIISEMEQIALAEEKSKDNIPENLQSSITYEAAEESLELLEQVIELLGEIY